MLQANITAVYILYSRFFLYVFIVFFSAKGISFVGSEYYYLFFVFGYYHLDRRDLYPLA